MLSADTCYASVRGRWSCVTCHSRCTLTLGKMFFVKNLTENQVVDWRTKVVTPRKNCFSQDVFGNLALLEVLFPVERDPPNTVKFQFCCTSVTVMDTHGQRPHKHTRYHAPLPPPPGKQKETITQPRDCSFCVHT